MDSKDALEEIGGVTFRKTCIAGRTYYKRFLPDDMQKL